MNLRKPQGTGMIRCETDRVKPLSIDVETTTLSYPLSIAEAHRYKDAHCDP
jgi:hypothetical protein